MSLDMMVPNSPETRQVAEVLQSMVAESRLRPEDQRHRVRHLAEGGRRVATTSST